MLNLNNIRIGTRIAAAIAVVGIIGIAASLFAASQMKEIDADYSEMQNTRPQQIFSGVARQQRPDRPGLQGHRLPERLCSERRRQGPGG